MSVLICGSRGYIGSAFKRELSERQILYFGLARQSYSTLKDMLQDFKYNNGQLVINCAAYIPSESVSKCDDHPAETIKANAVLPTLLACACQQLGVPLAHISTGCLWNDGLEHSEDDPPQRGFGGYCGTYVGTKLLAEEAVRKNCDQHYIWRVRLPFDEIDHPRNYLSKLARFDEVWDHENTICHRGDFVKACLDLWQMRADWGTYHVCNTGSMPAWNIALMLMDKNIRTFRPTLKNGTEGSSKLSVKKILDAGVKIRSVEHAIEDSIKNWKTNV